MDATVTHVNEACHLHLLRLRRLLSAYFDLFLGWHLAYLTLVHSPRFARHQPVPRERVFGAFRVQFHQPAHELLLFHPSFLPSLASTTAVASRSMDSIGEEAYSGRSAPQLHPFVMLEWKRLRRACADADRVWREDGAHSKGSQTLDDPWMPAHKFGAGMRMSANWLIARWWIPQRCSRNGKRKRSRDSLSIDW